MSADKRKKERERKEAHSHVFSTANVNGEVRRISERLLRFRGYTRRRRRR